MLKEFKEFAIKGNMVDMAVGIIIGAAFGGVVKSLVENIIMPPIGLLMGGLDFKDKLIVLKAADPEHGIKAVEFGYGPFITVLINFFIVAFAVFILVKAIQKVKNEKPAEPPAPPAPTKEEILLTEIRDLLKAKS
ncbi:MAG: large-conductance mechanosensitive channel protein MscL [Verrucomicrobiota bacterium]